MFALSTKVCQPYKDTQPQPENAKCSQIFMYRRTRNLFRHQSHQSQDDLFPLPV